MKQQLLILSDLWGAQKANYLSQYATLLQTKFDITFLDSCEIGQINITPYVQKSLHQQFINGGIELAADYLVKNYQKEVNILAFSIGGTIAWKAALAGLKVRHLYAISATRLRYETIKPSSKISLVYGELDIYRPNENWFENIGISDITIYDKEGHDLYQKNKWIEQTCKTLLL